MANPPSFKLLPKIELKHFQFIQTPFYGLVCLEFFSENPMISWDKNVQITPLHEQTNDNSTTTNFPLDFRISSKSNCHKIFKTIDRSYLDQNFSIELYQTFKTIKWITKFDHIIQFSAAHLSIATLEPIDQSTNDFMLKLFFELSFDQDLNLGDLQELHHIKIPKISLDLPLIAHEEANLNLSISQSKSQKQDQKKSIQQIEIQQKLSFASTNHTSNLSTQNPISLSLHLPILNFNQTIIVQRSDLPLNPLTIKTKGQTPHISFNFLDQFQQTVMSTHLYSLILILMIICGLLMRYISILPKKQKNTTIKEKIRILQNQGISSNYIETHEQAKSLKTLTIELFDAIYLEPIHTAQLQINHSTSKLNLKSVSLDFPLVIQKDDLSKLFELQTLEHFNHLSIHYPFYQVQTISIDPWPMVHMRIYLNTYQAVISIQYQQLFQKLNLIHHQHHLPLFDFSKQTIQILKLHLEQSIVFTTSIKENLCASLESALFNDHQQITEDRFQEISRDLQDAFKAIDTFELIKRR